MKGERALEKKLNKKNIKRKGQRATQRVRGERERERGGGRREEGGRVRDRDIERILFRK